MMQSSNNNSSFLFYGDTEGELLERKIWSEEWVDEVVVAEKGPVVGAGPEFDPSVTP